MCLLFVLHIAYTSLIFRFASLCSLRQYSTISTSIDNRLNLLYAYITFIHTTASLNMNALCYVTPYLYYSALISLYLTLFLIPVPNSTLLFLPLISKCVYLSIYIIRIAQLQGNHGYFLST